MSTENNTSSRAELYLERAISGGGTEGLPTPISRLDKLLYELAANGGGGGGVSSWNDLTDKPFYEETPEPIVWDGTVGDRVTFTADGLPTFVKVDDRMFTSEELVGSTTVMNDGQPIVLQSEDIVSFDCAILAAEGLIMSVYDVNVNLGGTSSLVFPETGTYLINLNDAYVSSLVFPSQVKTLDTKYLPDTIPTFDEVQAMIDAAFANLTNAAEVAM